MGKMNQDVDIDQQARNRLIERKGKLTWKALSAELGINQGYLYRVSSGKRHASNRLLHALGLSPRLVTVAPLSCGHAPSGKRCPICQPKTKRQPDPVVRWNRVEPAAMKALGILHAGHSPVVADADHVEVEETS